MKNLLIYFALLWFATQVAAQNLPQEAIVSQEFKELVILQPTGRYVNNLPEMAILEDSSKLYQATEKLINESFIKEVIDLYFLAQNHLINQGELNTLEPAYLALSREQGGFARTGFYLLQNEQQIDKSITRYVDIMEKTVWEDPARLMSITQLYPHELGHVIYGLLCSDSTRERGPGSVDMHYFPIVTDNATAFNEGFAEHLENASRLNEKNVRIKEGIFVDIERKKVRLAHPAQGLVKDYRLPFRLGYYRAGMLLWYQQLEDLRRYEQVMDGSLRFKNATLPLGRVENALSLRNTGILRQDKVRNLAQVAATEGMVSAFFTHLLTSELANRYLTASFYQTFLADTSLVINAPEQFFSPLQNQFLKNFAVLHQFVKDGNAERAQLIDFIEGYIVTFPEESQAIRQLFEKVTGLTYPDSFPRELWLLAKDHPHRLLLLDQFGAITMPVYTFNLNAAEPEDLMTIKGVDRRVAEAVITYREGHGFFNNLNQLDSIPGLSAGAVEAIQASAFDQDYFDQLPKSDLNLGVLIITPIKHLLYRSGGYFLFLLALLYLLFYRKEAVSPKKLVSIGLKMLFLWLLFVAAGLASLVFVSQQPLFIFVPLVMVVLLINILIYRKNKPRLRINLVMPGIMGLLVIYSLI